MLIVVLCTALGDVLRAEDHKTLLITDDFGGVWRSRTYKDVDRIIEIMRSAKPDIMAIDAASPDSCMYPSRVGHTRPNKNLEALRAAGKEPYAYLVDALKQSGITVLAAVRMNDHHGQLNNWGPWSRAHRQWSLGPKIKGQYILTKKPEDMEWREIGAMRKMDYAIEGVRNHRLAILREILETFDVDGLQLDFNRSAPFLSEPKTKNAVYLTEYLREVKKILVHRVKTKNRPMLLGIIVPWDIEYCRQEGLDVDSWIREGLVDYVSPGEGYYADWNIDIEPWSKLAAGTNVKNYPLVCGTVTQIHPHHRGDRPMLGDNKRLDNPKISAIAEGYDSRGADGMMFYNFYAQGDAGKYYSSLRRLIDPKQIPNLPRQYYYIRRMKYSPWELYTFGSKVLGVTAPAFTRLKLDSPGNDCSHDFHFWGNLHDKSATFRFKIKNDLPGDVLKVSLNGVELQGRLQRVQGKDSEMKTTFPVGIWETEIKSPPLTTGKNHVAVQLVEQDAKRTLPLEVWEFEIWINRPKTK